jgi:spore coat polysaccharide biosynthesis protein SpsF (cytidylyltransferase family)
VRILQLKTLDEATQLHHTRKQPQESSKTDFKKNPKSFRQNREDSYPRTPWLRIKVEKKRGFLGFMSS